MLLQLEDQEVGLEATALHVVSGSALSRHTSLGSHQLLSATLSTLTEAC